MDSRLALSSPFVLQNAATLGLAGHLLFRHHHLAIHILALQFWSKIGVWINQRLKYYLKIPPQINLAEANIASPLTTSFFSHLRAILALAKLGRLHHLMALVAQMGKQDQRYRACTHPVHQVAQHLQPQRVKQLISVYPAASNQGDRTS